MIIIIALTFLCSWTPFYLVSFISQVQENIFLKKSNFLFTMLFTHFVGFINSCLNPIIYYFMSEKFHTSFMRIFKTLCCFCCPTRLNSHTRLNRNKSLEESDPFPTMPSTKRGPLRPSNTVIVRLTDYSEGPDQRQNDKEDLQDSSVKTRTINVELSPLHHHFRQALSVCLLLLVK